MQPNQAWGDHPANTPVGSYETIAAAAIVDKDDNHLIDLPTGSDIQILELEVADTSAKVQASYLPATGERIYGYIETDKTNY